MSKYIIGLLFCSFLSLAKGNAPAIQLATVYQAQANISQYLVSEKYDGVRAIWTGKALLTRGGIAINPPSWFTAELPGVALDGELWIGYNQFAQISALVRTHNSTSEQWRSVSYLVFDAPNANDIFSERYKTYKDLIDKIAKPHIKAVEQRSFATKPELDRFFQQVLNKGGEGVMLHHQNAIHINGRSSNLMKYKPFVDEDAIVTGYSPGKGKYQGMVGALVVKNNDGVIFKLGSGLSDKLRKNPPPIGAVVSYRFQGLTKFGKPRFARFLRVRYLSLEEQGGEYSPPQD
ncbi:DNA ligase [Pseudoalteromonas sp. T1lg65]|uniref:DNA ligase n=1 Tax=Pseudoalteromonas sp. T1lg65 TaxID=2077101 RepID=UPI003F79E46A